MSEVVHNGIASGGCLCGQLRYVLKSLPKYMGYCHCRDCQKSTASAYAPYMGIASEEVIVTGQYTPFELEIDEGKISTRNFCPKCGSTVFGGDPKGGGMSIYAGSLDDPSLFKPANHIFVSQRCDWAMASDQSLPEYERLP